MIDDQKLLSVRVPPELKQKAQDAAAADRRSVSNWLCLILEQRYANKIKTSKAA